ncbi:lysophospholipid acyltransferase family protein [Crenobacter luteus]|uniref:Acyl-phosphate glycerol 3-phosphate acyltransferase n=1 Tax=Crenobacter luteus TaxID=1452487 RepID=A0A161SFP3_9NEIS|nr:lysophospholipid acyltransferase family protein [Crenobacter luteus]KZE31650.1 acyl-phosphate glycerol 3-phosphate acyltransferase [Crenobacter luteus]
MILWIRNLLYWLGLAVLTPPFAILAVLILPLPRRLRHRIISGWTHSMLWWLKTTCGLSYKVIGRENIPDTPSVIASKHQSGWETMALQQIFPPQVWVLKRELLWIPFFGWGLATMSPIAIDRGNRIEAQRKLMKQGRARLDAGFWIVVFPEGTRIRAGLAGKYKLGAARLAAQLQVPMVPVALNSGEFWPRNSFLKYPGEITVVIGKPILPDGRDAADMMAEAEGWIEARQREIGGAGPCAHPDDKARRAHARAA